MEQYETLKANLQELRKIYRNLGFSNEQITEIFLNELLSKLEADADIKFILKNEIEMKEI